jgi:hypothetical protein
MDRAKVVTPGAWTLREDGEQLNPYWRQYRVYAGELLVGDISLTHTHTDGTVNAHAMVAAPVLLEALEQVALVLRNAPGSKLPRGAAEALRAADTAINLAKGIK